MIHICLIDEIVTDLPRKSEEINLVCHDTFLILIIRLMYTSVSVRYDDLLYHIFAHARLKIHCTVNLDEKTVFTGSCNQYNVYAARV